METPGVGRTTLYTPEIAAQICERIATTQLGNDAIAAEFGINPDTLYVWKRKHQDFAESYAHAKADQQDLMAEKIIGIADEHPKCDIPTKHGSYEATDGAGVQRNRLRVDTLKWLMSKLAPKKYGERITAEHTGPGGGPLQIVSTIPRPPEE